VVLALHARMADCLARLGREPEAEREFQAEIAAIPWSRTGRVGLAMLYRSQGRDAEARTVLEGLVTSTPHAGADVYWTVAKTFADLGDARPRANGRRAVAAASRRTRASDVNHVPRSARAACGSARRTRHPSPPRTLGQG
jgi:predicted Zn-dependent protease